MTLGLLFSLLFTAAVAYTLGVTRVLVPDHIRLGKWSIRQAGKWDKHPCRMPIDPSTLTAVGSIWTCRCGRRWKFLERDESPYNTVNYWEERTPEKDLADAQKELDRAMKKLEERIKPDAITGPARKRDDDRIRREHLSKMARRETEHGGMGKRS